MIDLTDVASGKEALRRVVEREQRAGRRIIIFDAVSRRDLATIAEVALSMETVPLLAGSAGLAGEVARILVPGQIKIDPERQRTFRHVLIIGGSASAVTHAQLQRLQDGGLPSFELPRDLVSGNGRRGRRIGGSSPACWEAPLRAEASSSGPLPNAGPATAMGARPSRSGSRA